MAIEQQSSGGTAILTTIAVALLAFGLGWFVGSSNVDPSEDSAVATGAAVAPSGDAVDDSAKIPVGDSPIYGKADAPITVVDFSSLQCPFCARGATTIKELVEKYPNDVRVVFKHFPLAFQAQAKPASVAVEAAGRQGKFYEMKEKMFANMQEFRTADMTELSVKLAGELNLDIEQFKKDLADPAVTAKVDKDQKLGESLGVKGTPHFFVNGERVSGAQPLPKFEEIVKRQLDEAKELLAAGTSRSGLYAAMVDKNFAAEPAAPAAAERAPAPAQEVHMVPVRDTDATKGGEKGDYLVTIHEYSSFQCPFCARGAETMRAIHKKYPEQVRVVFKHFPLSFQQHSEPAARAAVAAQEQGKFWEMYDLLYENQKALGQAGIFDKLAGELNLNMAKFKADFESPAVAERVKQNQADGSSAGIRGTPGFLINGIKVVGAQPQPAFEQHIEAQIKIAEGIKKEKGLKGDALYAAVVEHNKKAAPAPGAAAPTPAAPPAPAPKIGDDELSVGNSPTKGPANAPVTIYEFSSFQCPFCARGAETLREIVKQYPTQVRVVYKQFPLPFQANSEPAARASLAAKEQGKFWEMYDLLYENQRNLAQDGLFERLAGQLGLNVEKFKKDFDDPKIAAQVKAEHAAGSAVGVRGTPAFFINGTRLVGAQPIDKFKEIIDAELAKK
ncbi:MAG: DsbA family protein [Bradymonadaceae bacterium]